MFTTFSKLFTLRLGQENKNILKETKQLLRMRGLRNGLRDAPIHGSRLRFTSLIIEQLGDRQLQIKLTLRQRIFKLNCDSRRKYCHAIGPSSRVF